MESAIVDGTVTEEGHGDFARFQELETVAGARGLEDRRADDSAGAHHADLGREEVHTSAAAARASRLAAEQLGHECLRGNALGQGMAVTPVRAEDDVVPAKVSTNPGRDRLLTHVGVAGAMDQTALMGSRQVLFAPTDRLHAAKER